jgi:hypothetical protein
MNVAAEKELDVVYKCVCVYIYIYIYIIYNMGLGK